MQQPLKRRKAANARGHYRRRRGHFLSSSSSPPEARSGHMAVFAPMATLASVLILILRRLLARVFEPRRDIDWFAAPDVLAAAAVDHAHDPLLRPVERRNDHRLVGGAPAPLLDFRARVDDLPPLAVPDAGAAFPLLA